ncbi:MAG: NADPH-dependent assimilatory sulfite reductase hemoprotein subunit, partial [Isosphaeraceae bacterium]
MEPTASTNSPKPSKIEAVKIASEYLKTFVADEVNNGLDHFGDDAATILKFHGSYQQDDRDLRTRLKRERKEKAYQLMVRVRIVGGKLTADQFLACHELARTLGNGTLRITTRQEFQLHSVLKSNLAAAIRQINESLLSTLAACGDVERNVLCCPAPIHDALRDQLQDDARRWAAHAAPRSLSYWEIWLDGEKIETLPSPGPSQVPAAADDAVEPLYGKAYLPR